MLGICNVPTGILEHAASFLAAPSRALLAVSLNDDSLQDSVAGIEWDTLDFGDIEKDLAAKLTDIDLNALLLRIDAVNTVKRLRLSGCVNITGAGLDPLRGSTIIEQIDLSLVGDHENPSLLDPEPPISCDHVLPILDSIIEIGNECALKYLQFPQVWRKGCVEIAKYLQFPQAWRKGFGFFYDFQEGSDQFKLQQFLTRYNPMLERRGFSCKICSGTRSMVDVGLYQWMCSSCPRSGDYALQSYTCYECLDQYCNQCYRREDFLRTTCCDTCQRTFCERCRNVNLCNSCTQRHFLDCMEFKDCSGFNCNEKCCSNCELVNTCSFCSRSICMACRDGCEACGKNYCFECSERYGTDEGLCCQGCQP